MPFSKAKQYHKPKQEHHIISAGGLKLDTHGMQGIDVGLLSWHATEAWVWCGHAEALVCLGLPQKDFYGISVEILSKSIDDHFQCGKLTVTTSTKHQHFSWPLVIEPKCVAHLPKPSHFWAAQNPASATRKGLVLEMANHLAPLFSFENFWTSGRRWSFGGF